MSNRKPVLLVLVCLFCILRLSAQDTHKAPLNEPDLKKPQLFTALPEKIDISVSDLESLLGNEKGKQASLQSKTSNQFRVSGEVTGAVTKYNGQIQSVVIRLAEYPGAILCISKVKTENGYEFTGRVTSLKSGDLLELKKKDEQYYFIKKGFYDLINE